MDLLPVEIVEAILTRHLKDYDPVVNKAFSVWIIPAASVCRCWHSILVTRRANRDALRSELVDYIKLQRWIFHLDVKRELLHPWNELYQRQRISFKCPKDALVFMGIMLAPKNRLAHYREWIESYIPFGDELLSQRCILARCGNTHGMLLDFQPTLKALMSSGYVTRAFAYYRSRTSHYDESDIAELWIRRTKKLEVSTSVLAKRDLAQSDMQAMYHKFHEGLLETCAGSKGNPAPVWDKVVRFMRDHDALRSGFATVIPTVEFSEHVGHHAENSEFLAWPGMPDNPRDVFLAIIRAANVALLQHILSSDHVITWADASAMMHTFFTEHHGNVDIMPECDPLERRGERLFAILRLLCVHSDEHGGLIFDRGAAYTRKRFRVPCYVLEKALRMYPLPDALCIQDIMEMADESDHLHLFINGLLCNPVPQAGALEWLLERCPPRSPDQLLVELVNAMESGALLEVYLQHASTLHQTLDVTSKKENHQSLAKALFVDLDNDPDRDQKATRALQTLIAYASDDFVESLETLWLPWICEHKRSCYLARLCRAKGYLSREAWRCVFVRATSCPTSLLGSLRRNAAVDTRHLSNEINYVQKPGAVMLQLAMLKNSKPRTICRLICMHPDFNRSWLTKEVLHGLMRCQAYDLVDPKAVRPEWRVSFMQQCLSDLQDAPLWDPATGALPVFEAILDDMEVCEIQELVAHALTVTNMDVRLHHLLHYCHRHPIPPFAARDANEVAMLDLYCTHDVVRKKRKRDDI